MFLRYLGDQLLLSIVARGIWRDGGAEELNGVFCRSSASYLTVLCSSSHTKCTRLSNDDAFRDEIEIVLFGT